MAPTMKPRRGKYTNYSVAAMEKAMYDVATGRLGLRAAAEKYDVPKSTLSDRYQGKHISKNGRPHVLSPRDENHLVHGILTAANWGYPLTASDIRGVVKGFLDKKGVVEKRFNNNEPGPKWLKYFMKRHKEVLSARLCENIKRHRAAVTTEVIQNFFSNLKETLGGVPAENIVNYDETNMTDDPGQQQVIVRRGSKHPERIIDTSKSSTSVMFAVSAGGDRLPVYVVYKAINLHDTWTKNGPRGTLYNRSASGWFDSFIFSDWFHKVALPYFRTKNGKKNLIGDNLASHISMDVITKCEEHNIQFVLLPANSTNLCQPLDVAYFRPLKRAWKATLLEWKKRHRGTIPKEYFPMLLNKTLNAISESEHKNIKSGFRACGIFPLNQNEVLKRLPTETVHQTADSAPEWCQIFSNHLKDSRVADTAPKRLRKKKLNVPAGRAITAAETLGGEETDDRSQNNNEEFDDEADEIIEEEAHDECEIVNDEEDSDEEIPLAEIKKRQVNNLPKDNNYKPEQYVVVQFLYNKGTKHETEKKFVAKILNIAGNVAQVSCLRQKDLGVFVFPLIEDINEVNLEDICSILSPLEEKRGRFKFLENLAEIL